MVCSTHVEMNRASPANKHSLRSLLHARGDEPNTFFATGTGTGVCSTHVEMNRVCAALLATLAGLLHARGDEPVRDVAAATIAASAPRTWR